jgi:phage terminase large subunit
MQYELLSSTSIPDSAYEMATRLYKPAMLSPRSSAANSQALAIPFNFTPRAYQEAHLFRPLFPHHYADLRDLGVQPKKRICLVWHRRAGKDKALINAIVLAAWEEVGNYLYLLPEQTQARKVIWRGIDGDGFRFLDHIPDDLCKGGAKGKYVSELLVELKNGSTIQFGGSDQYNSWMGTNPKGIIFSEYSLQDPMAWNYFRPILVENGGWAVFNYTVRGKNHGYDLAQIASKNPKIWHYSILTIKDTKRPDGSPVVTHEQYLEEIAGGMPEPVAKQEFYCDWESALFGSYYGDLVAKAYAEKRVGFFPHDPTKLVFTFWDVGLDCNAVWFAQEDDHGHPVVINYYEKTDEKFSSTLSKVMKAPYTYGDFYGPHDLKNRDPEKNTRLNTATSLGADFVETPRTSRDDSVEAVRSILPRCRLNEQEAYGEAEEGWSLSRGIDALRSYERVFDRTLQRFRDQPVHNWASHGATAFEKLALNWQEGGMSNDAWFSKKLPEPQNDL